MQTDTDAPVFEQYWQGDPRRSDAHRLAHKYAPPSYPASLPTVDPRKPGDRRSRRYAVVGTRSWWRC